MKKDIQHSLKKYLREVNIVEPNDLGIPFLTKIYRKINKFFKTAPFIFIVPIAIFSAIIGVYLFRILAVRLVSILQYGF